jgi:hypothetical protein
MRNVMYLALAFVALGTVAALKAQPAVNQGGQQLSGAWMGFTCRKGVPRKSTLRRSLRMVT